MRGLAGRIGCTEGQAYTLVIGAVLALALTIGGLPPALRGVSSGTQIDATALPIPGSSDSAAPAPVVVPPPLPAEPLPAEPLPLGPLPIFGGDSVLALGGPPEAGSPPAGAGSSPDRVGGSGSLDPGRGTPDGRVTVVGASYARAVGGPAGTVGVPDDGVPVGARAGSEDARAYLRLAGDGSDLVLKVHPAASSTFLADQAAISACPVAQPGEVVRGSALSQAPPVNSKRCARGTVGEDGTWTFDLTVLGDTTDLGVALVAELQPGQTFQVTFQAPTSRA